MQSDILKEGQLVMWYNMNIFQSKGLVHFDNNVVSGGFVDVGTEIKGVIHSWDTTSSDTTLLSK